MDRSRLTAMTDGFLAIIITIMVLGLVPPGGARWGDLRAVGASVLLYGLSFIYLGIYWNNHHHFYHLVDHVTGGLLWANLHLMFWLSLIPFATAWLGQNPRAAAPTALYGILLLLAALAWGLMEKVALRLQGRGSRLARALGRDWKVRLSPLLYVAGIGVAFWRPWLGDAFYILCAGLWLIPDRRVERALRSES
ncbi:MAG TPA: TMEM175 family protein [Terriglobales bacterium]|nr:TMEM175 family protein [Terriglobales bacterium]